MATPSSPRASRSTRKPTPAPVKAQASTSSPAARVATPAPRRPKPSRTGALAAPAHVDLKVDRALKRRWDEALEALLAAKREGAGAFDVQ